MNDTINPFEQALSMAGSAPDPFADAIADPFGYVPPTPETTPLDLGSQQTASNPFETPENANSECGGPNGTSAPVLSFGSQPDAANPPVNTAKPVAPAKDIKGGPLNPPSPIAASTDTTELELASGHATGPLPETGLEQTLAPESAPEPIPDTEDIENPLTAAMDEQEQASIFAKLPIFELGAMKEPIENLNQTFEDLRVAKLDDFPELEDGIRVSWEVIYGKVRKGVPTPKKTKIGEFKRSIETSKEFMDALKKDKDKSPDCIVKPRVTAQSKGEHMKLPMYKGVFTSLEEAKASGKPITLVPGRDGKVYEIRREDSGTYTTPSGECGELSNIEAGFIPALPQIPCTYLLDILCFFRSLISSGYNYEAIANIYWDRVQNEFITVIPKQRVTATRADSELSENYGPERYIHYMDIHSHNIMPAAFSAQDDRDEKATRLYAVIGRLNTRLPEISLRMSNGGKYLSIDPRLVFDSIEGFYPSGWYDRANENLSTSDAGACIAPGHLNCLDVMCA